MEAEGRTRREVFHRNAEDNEQSELFVCDFVLFSPFRSQILLRNYKMCENV